MQPLFNRACNYRKPVAPLPDTRCQKNVLTSPMGAQARLALGHRTASSGMPPASHLPRRAAVSDGNPAQDTTKHFKLAPQPDEGGDSKCSSTTAHDNEMPPDGDSGVTNSGTLNDMPFDGILLAEPGAGGAPPDGAYLVERQANKEQQVNTTPRTATRSTRWRVSTGWGPGSALHGDRY